MLIWNLIIHGFSESCAVWIRANIFFMNNSNWLIDWNKPFSNPHQQLTKKKSYQKYKKKGKKKKPKWKSDLILM